jgi:alcohol/geraniol dehydrogenase (NADP+)
MIHAWAAFEAKGELKPFEYDPGPLLPQQVELEVLSCGVCHSDLSMINNEWGASRYPLVAGHEVVGKVVALGEGVGKLRIGQVVGLGWHRGYCNQCRLCDTGEHNLCAKAKYTIIGHHGGFADKVRAHVSSLVPVPDGMELDSLGPMFCGGITVYNPLVQYNIKPGDRVAVIGIGGLGHLALQFLNAWGCEVTAFTSSEAKRTQALSLGAHHTLDSRDAKVLAAARGRFDLILSTVSVKLDWNLYLATLRSKGRLHFVGMSVEPLDIGIQALMNQQLSVSSSPVGSPATMAAMLEFARLHDIKPVIEKFKFSDINAALARLESGQAHYRVVLQG